MLHGLIGDVVVRKIYNEFVCGSHFFLYIFLMHA